MSNFTGIKTINHEGGKDTYELHWNDAVKFIRHLRCRDARDARQDAVGRRAG